MPEKSVPLLVRDLMKVGVPTCPPETPVDEIARWMLEKSLEAVIVLDPEEGHALGYVSWDELVKVYGERQAMDDERGSMAGLTANDVMCERIPQVPPDIPLAAAVQLMNDQGVRTLFLMHHAGGVVYPAAYLSYSQILRHIAARNPEELRDLGVGAERKTPLETFIEKRDAARKRAGGRM